jgi:transcriptional pleiotropic regulator of transition state genes
MANIRKGKTGQMMKSKGIVRKVDELGRVVIPIELRRTLGIGEKDALEIYVDGERIMLKKYEPACIFTGNAENLIYYRGKMISKECLAELAEIYNSMNN